MYRGKKERNVSNQKKLFVLLFPSFFIPSFSTWPSFGRDWWKWYGCWWQWTITLHIPRQDNNRKGAFVTDLNQSNGPLVLPGTLCPCRWRQYRLEEFSKYIKAVQLNDPRVTRWNLPAVMPTVCFEEGIRCTVMHWHRLSVEAVLMWRRGAHCVISSPCHPRDYHEMAAELLMKLKAWTNNSRDK